MDFKAENGPENVVNIKVIGVGGAGNNAVNRMVEETIGGVEYKYFEYGEDIYGLAENLIFNNNGQGIQHPDVNVTFAEGADPKATMKAVRDLCKRVEDDCEIYL